MEKTNVELRSSEESRRLGNQLRELSEVVSRWSGRGGDEGDLREGETRRFRFGFRTRDGEKFEMNGLPRRIDSFQRE